MCQERRIIEGQKSKTIGPSAKYLSFKSPMSEIEKYHGPAGENGSMYHSKNYVLEMTDISLVSNVHNSLRLHSLTFPCCLQGFVPLPTCYV